MTTQVARRRTVRGVLAVSSAAIVALSMLAAAGGTHAAQRSHLGQSLSLYGRTGLTSPMTMAAAASNASGVQAFAWVKFSRRVGRIPSGYGGPRSVIRARVRRTSGRLTLIERLSPSSGRAFVPVVGVDGHGVVTAAWLQQLRRGRFAVVVAVRRPGRRFGRPVTIGHTRIPSVRVLYPDVLRADYGAQPALAVAPDGSAVVAWRGSDALHVSARGRGHAARMSRPDFMRPQALPLGAEPEVVFDPHDRAYVVWAQPAGPAAGIELAVARPGRTFEPVRVSPSGVVAREPTIAVTTDGSAIVAYREEVRGGSRVQAVVRGPHGTLKAPVALSDAARFASGAAPLGGGSGPSVVADPQGEAIVVWQQATVPELSGGLVSAVWSAGAFGATDVVDAGAAYEPIMAIDGRGNTVLTDVHGSGGFGDWRLRSPGGTFEPPNALPGSPVLLVRRSHSVVTVAVREGVQGERTRLYDVAIE